MQVTLTQTKRRAMRQDHDARLLNMQRMPFGHKIAHYLESPRDYFIDRQFGFGSAGTDFPKLIEAAMNDACTEESDFDRKVSATLTLANKQLDDLRLKMIHEANRIYGIVMV